MQRRLLHAAFWLAYLVQDSIQHYTWMENIVKKVSVSQEVLMAIETAFVALPVKLFIVYYFINYGVNKLVLADKNPFRLVLEISFLLSLAILLFRIAFYFIINPLIYKLEAGPSLFNTRSLLIAVLEIGYITGIAITLKLLRQQILSNKKEKDLVKEKLQTELKYLKNQTNPHFLFNTLNNIYALARKKSDKTPEVVLKLSELLSFMLYESDKETISFKEELKMLQDYIDLQTIRYNDRLTINLQKDIDNGFQKIAPLILIPLVENAFKHGVSESRFKSFINISVILKHGQLNYCVENSIENCKTKKHESSIGLINIRRQLELIYKQQQLTVYRDEKTFKVNVSINLNSYVQI